jgi:hypothetical protein
MWQWGLSRPQGCRSDRRRPLRAGVGCHTPGTSRRRSSRRLHKSGRPHGSHADSAGSACTRPSGPAVGVAGQHPAPSSSTCRRHSNNSVRRCVNTAELARCQAKSPRRLQPPERRKRAETSGVVTVTEVVATVLGRNRLRSSSVWLTPPTYGGLGCAGDCIYMRLSSIGWRMTSTTCLDTRAIHPGSTRPRRPARPRPAEMGCWEHEKGARPPQYGRVSCLPWSRDAPPRARAVLRAPGGINSGSLPDPGTPGAPYSLLLGDYSTTPAPYTRGQGFLGATANGASTPACTA